MTRALRPYALALWTLLGLFMLRVAGQLLIASGAGGFLPPWEEWFSGAVPYPQLLASQIVIILIGAKVCLDFTRGRGFFVVPRRQLGSALLMFGSVYLGVMVVRYIIRMSLYPPERWTGGSIPIFFHWVLASFSLVAGTYHVRLAPRARSRHPTSARVGYLAIWSLVVIGVAAWVAYQLGPTLLARQLDARPAEYAVRIERSVPMTTSDGVTLKADIFHPQRAGRTPTILVRIPFSKALLTWIFETFTGRFWAERGYTVVVQGTRGRYESEGVHRPLADDRRDGIETLAWLRQQPWFDGRLGMWGGSSFGYTQWAVADHLPAPPSGRSALMIQVCSSDMHGMFYPGGALSLASALAWAVRSRSPVDEWPALETLQAGFNGLPLIEADDRALSNEVRSRKSEVRNQTSDFKLQTLDVEVFDEWVSDSERDAYWQAIDGDDRPAALRGPVLLAAGWFDPFLPTQLADFVRIRRTAAPAVAAATRLVVAPWAHAENIELPGGVRTRNYRIDSLAPSLPWFDRHLRSMGPGVQPDAPVRLYVMGVNVWRDEQEWPLARARETAWYLHSDGHANTASGDGTLTVDLPRADEPPDVFAFDPLHPVPSRGGAMLGYPAGVERQNDVETRRDVLVYSTPPLTGDLEVTGPITALLYVSTSAPSTDFTAKLVDVHPDGAAYNVSDGILRRAYEAAANPAASRAMPIEIALWPTSMVFRQGHRLRLEVSSSNFPRFDRNPNTGTPIATATATAVATQAVHHGARAPSRLVLPIVPPER